MRACCRSDSSQDETNTFIGCKTVIMVSISQAMGFRKVSEVDSGGTSAMNE